MGQEADIAAGTKPRPFLKWAGGKQRLLKHYRRLLPERAKTYHEPFVGSGALFFYLRAADFARRYRLHDVNEELINTYVVVRDHLDALIEALAEHQRQHSPDYYYQVRAWDREAGWAARSSVERAARMIYLNKTCYNGLWRVNRKGYFNVPIGRYRRPNILDRPRLHAASDALQGVEIEVERFETVVERAVAGDFIYFDPPYVPLTSTANFTDYYAGGFGQAEQEALAAIYRRLDAKGCRVMLSNSDTDLVRALYCNEAYQIIPVQARRAINSQAGKRGPVSEVVVLNYPPFEEGTLPEGKTPSDQNTLA
jgi:DNA adenine methylase